MKLAIIGSRSFTGYPLLCRTIEEYWDRAKITEVISGGAVGADSLGARWAKENGVELTEHLPDWEKHGRAAGFIRNELTIKDADAVLAFWDGLSKGTGNSLSIAKRLKKPTLIIYY